MIKQTGRALFFLAMMLPPLAFAQGADTAAQDITAQDITAPAAAANADNKQPLEITADQTLEWHRNDNQFVANGNVVAKQGDTSIKSDKLVADYRQGKGKSQSFAIYQLTATGHVNIDSRGSTASGDKAVYDVDKGVATLTGDNLKLASPGQTVTARDKFEYRVNDGVLTATGGAVAVRGQDRIAADVMSAAFAKGAGGAGLGAMAGAGGADKNLERLDAGGHVVITTPDETLTGDKASYTAADNIARITGNVKITRGPNTLEGESAEVNLATNISTMRGGASEGGRVRGVFYPDSMPKSGAQDAGAVSAPGVAAAPPASVPLPAPATAGTAP
jgi:lipopolysaccharide export system protein LptA